LENPEMPRINNKKLNAFNIKNSYSKLMIARV